ncbi:glycosyltransferase [Catellatospora tritici]|uniref:glycosyltransferase n=1 Tax=Catellatospora tritici TaxID=2851566 RepID=UPI001C2D15CB|nr:glycosyltransferase family 2 protein [Catellatospora tritici]MBV1856663.1 glycosyltransferase family 2 protein [Catellatospora tritici]
MRRAARQSNGKGQLPQARLRSRVRGTLRKIKNRLGAGSRPALAQWTGALGGAPDASGLLTRDGDRVRIAAKSAAHVRAKLWDGLMPGKARHVEIAVEDWAPPMPHWSGRLGTLPGLLSYQVNLPREGGAAAVSVSLAEPLPLLRVVPALLAVLAPWHPLPAVVSADVAVDGNPVPWLYPDTSVLTLSPGLTEEGLRPYDVSVAGTADTAARPLGEPLVGSRFEIAPVGKPARVVVDAVSASPHGRLRHDPEQPIGSLRLAPTENGAWWELSGGGKVLSAGRIGDPLDGDQSAVLTALSGARLVDGAQVPASAQAAALAQLAMTGLVLSAPRLPADAASLLSGDLVKILSGELPDADADGLDWETRGVAQRREAMRSHATGFALPAATVGSYPSLSRPPSVTALLVTRRPDYLKQALAMMAAQTYPELDVIVGLHNCELPAAQREELESLPLPVRVVALPRELTFGEAIGATTALATGSLVTKVDDDDRYGPEHIWDLVLARHYSGAHVVGKGAEFVYLAPYDTTVRRTMGHEMYDEVVAGGTMLMSRGDLEAVGGWRPVARSIDRALLDRVLRDGGLVYRTHAMGFLYTRHNDGHTWDPGLDYFLQGEGRTWPGIPPYDEFAAPAA